MELPLTPLYDLNLNNWNGFSNITGEIATLRDITERI